MVVKLLPQENKLQMNKDTENYLAKLIQDKVSESLKKSGKFPNLNEAVKKQQEIIETPKSNVLPSTTKQQANNVVKEALIASQGSFILKTEKLSKEAKVCHENLYRNYVQAFNKVSSELDAVNKYEADCYSSMYRSFKIDECFNLNAIKLHELYFNNISDLSSTVNVDSLPFMKFSRDFGNFENWQFDFMAAAMSAREGWAITVFEPFRNTYMNICVDSHNIGIPVNTVPVLVIDMWSHSFFTDYGIDKRSYLVCMMREINWDVVEARMSIAEKSDLNALYHIKPAYNDNPLLSQASINASRPPIPTVVDDKETLPSSTPTMAMDPTMLVMEQSKVEK